MSLFLVPNHQIWGPGPWTNSFGDERAMQGAASLSIRAVRPSGPQALVTFRLNKHLDSCKVIWIFSTANKRWDWLLFFVKAGSDKNTEAKKVLKSWALSLAVDALSSPNWTTGGVNLLFALNLMNDQYRLGFLESIYHCKKRVTSYAVFKTVFNFYWVTRVCYIGIA